MSVVKVEKNSYTVESLYQWDLNQVLQIYGLSLPSIPEIHFTNEAMSRAIVRQATMDAAGVISVNVPNSLLQKPYKIKAYVCIYSGNTFESLYKIEIPVKARTQPSDYTLVDDEEVYSFNALENRVLNVLSEYEAIGKKYDTAVNNLNTATSELTEAKSAYEVAKEEVAKEADNAAKEAVAKMTAGDVGAYTKEETLTDDTKTLFELDTSAIPDDVFQKIKALVTANATAIANGVKIETGSYTGAVAEGTSSGTKSWTFTRVPKFILIFCNDSGTKSTIGHGFIDVEHLFGLNLPFAEGEAHWTKFGGATFSVTGTTVKMTWSGNTSPSRINVTGKTYYYYAFS